MGYSIVMFMPVTVRATMLLFQHLVFKKKSMKFFFRRESRRFFFLNVVFPTRGREAFSTGA